MNLWKRRVDEGTRWQLICFQIQKFNFGTDKTGMVILNRPLNRGCGVVAMNRPSMDCCSSVKGLACVRDVRAVKCKPSGPYCL